MDIVLKRAIAANEEIGSANNNNNNNNNNEQNLGAQPKPEPAAPQPGAFAGAPGEGLHRREDMRFSLIGVVSPSEDDSNATPDNIQSLDPETISSINPSVPTMDVDRSGSSGNGNANNLPSSEMNNRLSEAIPVVEDELPDMEAQPYDVEEAKRKSLDKNRKQRKFFMAMALAFVCIVVAVVLGVKFGKMGEGATAPTVAPSYSPSSEPSTAMDLLLESLPENMQQRICCNTPQYKAWEWLRNHPRFYTFEEWKKQQLYALATFFYSFGGDTWYKPIKEGWLDYERDECKWFSGFEGSFDEDGEFHETAAEAINDCKRGKFRRLNLKNLQVSGPAPAIPPEIALLTTLSQIILSRNGINTSLVHMLPTELLLLTDLKTLELNSNQMFGPVPSHLGMMTSLTSLYLGNNSLTGPLPSEIGLMTSLGHLLLNDNNFFGPLPSELSLMTRLYWVDLDDNNFSGQIPSELGMMPIDYLWLSQNSFTGSIPHQLATITGLRTLRLENNNLEGTIPERFCSMGVFDEAVAWGRLGLSFDCNDQLCGCCWCPCPTSSYDYCQTNPLYLLDREWPGAFPIAVNGSNSIIINIGYLSYFPETKFDWSRLGESGLWEVQETGATRDPSSVNSYTMDVESNSLYRLKIFYEKGHRSRKEDDWFTITNSTPSNEHTDGTVVWDAMGIAFEHVLAAFVWIDPSGNAQLADCIPGEGYALDGKQEALVQAMAGHNCSSID